ncbi:MULTISPECIES: hypothetical protein [Natrialbaceae]|uniref:hypothetical protein n=1 Tax=Natrialbaceae TaxID=1644061 RepID=UPI00207D6F62|nr:hypothetical protein [Natronococcus sp. CG52]
MYFDGSSPFIWCQIDMDVLILTDFDRQQIGIVPGEHVDVVDYPSPVIEFVRGRRTIDARDHDALTEKVVVIVALSGSVSEWRRRRGEGNAPHAKETTVG